MSNTFLTEARFIELLDKKLEEKFDKKLQKINDTLIKLEGFQKHEAGAIEYELNSVLKTHLALEYPLLHIAEFPFKSFNDPYTGKIITDLDAAFLLSPLRYVPDYDRLREAMLPYPPENKSPNKSSIFVLVEAKHYISRNKIATKLWQFDKLRAIFALAKRIANIQIPETLGITKEFIRTVERNAFLANIDECMLVLGAAFWEKGLLKQLQSAVKKRNNLAGKFRLAPEADKVKIYHAIRAIERKWYTNSDHSERVLVDLSPEQIVLLDSVDGAMAHVRFIQPSGGRYSVDSEHEVVGIAQLALKGGVAKRKTRKNIVGNPEEKEI